MGLERWRGRKVLVTGHTGFKGAWLCLWLERLGADVTALALPPATRPNLYELLAPWQRLQGRIVDLRDEQRTRALIHAADAEVLFHLAAQSLVPAAQRDPLGAFATNVMGTAHVLQAALGGPALRCAIVTTTDKVYANDNRGRAFVEDDALGGEEPYSASKAACEHVVAAYRAPFAAQGKALAAARAGNVIGGGDWAADRIVPDLVRALDSNAKTAIRNPAGIRPWQHVLDPLAGYLAYAERLLQAPDDTPAALNFGPDPQSSRPVSDLIERFLPHFRGHPGCAYSPTPQLREAQVLTLDSARARAALGWHPRLGFEAAVDWTAAWYEAQRGGQTMRNVSLEQIERYEALA
jgi:CDP-glucose 4,6-dehydratase